MSRALILWTLAPLLIGLPAIAQERPPQAVIDAITRAIGPALPPIVTRFTRAGASASDEHCGMQHFDVHISFGPQGKQHRHKLMLDRQPAERAATPNELFAAIPRIAVDADGAARAYHPEDPYGSCSKDGKPCALDEFSSGGLMVFSGAQRTKSPVGHRAVEPELAPAWRRIWPLIRDRKIVPQQLQDIAGPAARAGRYLFHSAAENVTAVFNRHIIPSDREGFPCRRGARDPHPGYFIAATTLTQRDAGEDNCRPARYLDSEQVPFFVLPQGDFGNVRVGDVVIGYLKAGARERIAYGIVGDTGPIEKFGEGSIAFNQELLGKTELPMRNKFDTWKLDQSSADWSRQRPHEPMSMAVLALGNTARLLNGDYSRQNIVRVAAQRFAAWNGDRINPTARMNACLAHAMKRQN